MLPRDDRQGGIERNKVDPDSFAVQVNYLAALGRLVVPRAFAFVGLKVLFVGHEPFDAEELGGLLPDGADWYEQEYAPEGFMPDVLVLGRVFPKGLIKLALESSEGSPKVVPQEGFLDEVLFGHDWWGGGKLGSLLEMVYSHRGLQAARSAGALRPIGIEAPPGPVEKKGPISRERTASSKTAEPSSAPTGATKPNSTFVWPSTEVKEPKSASEGELDLKARSRLNELGYNTNEPRSVRWRILTTKAIPELGLQQVVHMIAWYCRFFRKHPKFRRAIDEWEHDLERLKREFYPNHRPRFAWPRSEP